MNIWVSRLYDASKAKMLKKPSYNLNFPWKYLISELTSLKSLSEYFKNSSGPNFGRMQMKQSASEVTILLAFWAGELQFTLRHAMSSWAMTH